MKKLFLFIALPFAMSFVHAQVQGTINNENGEAIIFANIWIKGTMQGTATNEKGFFSIPSAQKGDTLVCSTIGYEASETLVDKESLEIILKKGDYELPLAEVTNPKREKEKKWGTFKKRKSKYRFGCSQIGWKVATKIPYESNFKKTPFIKTLKVLTKSNTDSAKYKLTICSIGKDGKPSFALHNEPIFGYAEKSSFRKRKAKINIEHLNIRIPKSGVFIIFEWLLIPENYFEREVTNYTTKEKAIRQFYEPSMCAVPSKKKDLILKYSYENKKWTNHFSHYHEENYRLAIELLLSN